MKIAFYSVTYGTCVGQLRGELLPLEELAETWKFPYDLILYCAFYLKVKVEKHLDDLIAGIIL
ncbi:hypothetical protein [Paenibacillus macquariensis]|uniref:Uncharacterized protein n=1 Tax=Paenibacillus macquariensis TaxID=948756 RepID=A0ABY1JW34_9BACL|nr:hypothetical protein [Paenibacillus macquariensis]SIQ82529.1 hypothetical protein SAMN05421578_104229 [Paenibacillus macquariensis]